MDIGYLAWRLKTIQRKSTLSEGRRSSCQLTGCGPTARGDASFNPEVTLREEPYKEANSFMKYSSDEAAIRNKMKMMFDYRCKMVLDENRSSSVLTEFPRFRDVRGLIEQDFILEFGEDVATRFLERWLTVFKHKVIQQSKTLPTSTDLEEVIYCAEGASSEEELDETLTSGWDSDLASIILLFHLIPPSCQGYKRRGKVSPSQDEEHHVVFQKVCNSGTSVQEHADAMNSTTQPYPLAVGTKRSTIHEFFIVLDKQVPHSATESTRLQQTSTNIQIRRPHSDVYTPFQATTGSSGTNREWAVTATGIHGLIWTQSVTQTPSLLLNSGHYAQMDCRHNLHGSYYHMYWFQQLPGQGLRLIVHTLPYKPPDFGNFSQDKYSASKTVSESGSFTVKHVEPSNSGVYLCAVSSHTDADTCHTIPKPHKGGCVGIKVHQTPPALIKKPGDKVQLVCTHNLSEYRVILWYQQAAGQTDMKYIGHVNYKDVTMEESYKQNFNISGDLSTSVSSNKEVKVVQTPGQLLASPNEEVRLTCKHKDQNFNTILWYQRSKGDTALKLIGFMYYQSLTIEPSFVGQFNISGNGESTAELHIGRPRHPEHSAEYFAAAR
ncbi:uncharacterized protein LOC115784280 [Archocentrus centrarchus]|uniref:uncharacterized protein LOC115784280 n=1 Tax=Archocentrus centrarchus TaxID=63155 RepID=UPI0011EA1CE3|nr:uncharacterized protein LOC115784280 [Archocentrus centrarchus]